MFDYPSSGVLLKGLLSKTLFSPPSCAQKQKSKHLGVAVCFDK